MTRTSLQHSRPRPTANQLARYVGGFLIALSSPAFAQDIRGIEVCTAEKQMERRTGCLQANVEFLQQALAKLTRETQEKIAAAGRDLTAARAEITELKSALTRINSELTQMKAKAESGSGKKIESGGNK
jgi:esterase/lipase